MRGVKPQQQSSETRGSLVKISELSDAKAYSLRGDPRLSAPFAIPAIVETPDP